MIETLPGEPIVFDVSEDAGPVRLELSAPSLQAGDSVIVEAFVTPTADPTIPTADSDDVRLITTSRIFWSTRGPAGECPIRFGDTDHS